MSFLGLPWFMPTMVVVALLAALASGSVARVLGTRRAVGALLIMSVGVVLAATLTPQGSAFAAGEIGSGSCNLERLRPAGPWTYLALGEALGNVLLLVPLGLAIALLPASRGRTRLLAGAIALPLVVEGIQLSVVVLNRACESADVIDNLLGLALGLGIGWAVNRAGGGRLGARHSGA